MSNIYKSVLTIAGSDSGGGAGIQADIKSISACGAYAASVITATTAQNTQGVSDVHPIPIEHVKKQLEAVFSDIDFAAVKIGMLYSSQMIAVVRGALKKYGIKNTVLDPVMVATSGDKLITDQSIDSLKEFLADVMLITPNIPEAEILINQPISLDNLAESALFISKTYNTSVLLKGGHLANHKNEVYDLLCLKSNHQIIVVKNPYIHTTNTHGTGCSLSSAIAAYLALGNSMQEAVRKAANYVNRAINSGKNRILGHGNGPIDHFTAFRDLCT